MAKTIAFLTVGLALLVAGYFPELYIPSMRTMSNQETRSISKLIFGVAGIPGILLLVVGYGGILQIRRKRKREQLRNRPPA